MRTVEAFDASDFVWNHAGHPRPTAFEELVKQAQRLETVSAWPTGRRLYWHQLHENVAKMRKIRGKHE